MPYDVTERDVEVAAAVIAATPLIDAPHLPAPSWMGLARRILEEVERDRNGRKSPLVPICITCGKPAIGRCEATSSIYHRTN